ncbi:MAG: hypothetical protein IJF94_00655 [Eubacterium sp.]|nr:hypothetical protein [Eubacterium sp.]
MKKVIVLGMVSALVIGLLAGCGCSKNKQTQTSAHANQAAETGKAKYNMKNPKSTEETYTAAAVPTGKYKPKSKKEKISEARAKRKEELKLGNSKFDKQLKAYRDATSKYAKAIRKYGKDAKNSEFKAAQKAYLKQAKVMSKVKIMKLSKANNKKYTAITYQAAQKIHKALAKGKK